MRCINTAIISGPTGAIGTALCKKLSENKIHTYIIVRPESPRKDHLKEIPGVELIECDIANLGRLSVEKSDLSADVFFHLAWVKTTGQGRNDMQAQIQNIQIGRAHV